MGQLVGRCLAWPQPNIADSSTQGTDTLPGPLGPSPSLPPPPVKGCREGLPWVRGGRGCFPGLESSPKEDLCLTCTFEAAAGSSTLLCPLPEQQNEGKETARQQQAACSYRDGRVETKVTLGDG